MNIAITTLLSPAKYNGLTNYIKHLVQGLQEADSKHTFYIILNKEMDDFLSIDHPNLKKVFVEIPHHPRPIMRLVFFIWLNFFAGRLYKKHSIDLVHYPNPVPLLNTFGVNHITTIHDLAEFKGLRHSGFHRLFRIFAYKSVVKRSKIVLTVSEFSKKEISKYLKCHIDRILVTPLASTFIGGRQNVYPKPDKPYLLHIGGDKSNKNFEITIKAFEASELAEKLDLYFMGHFDERRWKSRYEHKSMESVRFIGYVSKDKIEEMYSSAFALVYPSLYEGFGLPILEAMSLGVPVITSNIGAMSEVAGSAALLVDPEDQKSIAGSFKRLFDDEDLKKSLISEGFKRAGEFNWNETVKKTLLGYDSI